jgi:hypothetical protein
MKKSRHGKIARLPFSVREELNRRMRDGESGKMIVEWLNGLAEVREMVMGLFGGKGIREQNLSEWRKGGYRDWLAAQERVELTVRMGEEVAALAEGRGVSMVEAMGKWVVAQYGAEAMREARKAEGKERWKLMREMCADFVKLRAGEQSGVRLGLEERRLRLRELEAGKADAGCKLQDAGWSEGAAGGVSGFSAGSAAGVSSLPLASLRLCERPLNHGCMNGPRKDAKTQRIINRSSFHSARREDGAGNYEEDAKGEIRKEGCGSQEALDRSEKPPRTRRVAARSARKVLPAGRRQRRPGRARYPWLRSARVSEEAVSRDADGVESSSSQDATTSAPEARATRTGHGLRRLSARSAREGAVSASPIATGPFHPNREPVM